MYTVATSPIPYMSEQPNAGHPAEKRNDTVYEDSLYTVANPYVKVLMTAENEIPDDQPLIETIREHMKQALLRYLEELCTPEIVSTTPQEQLNTLLGDVEAMCRGLITLEQKLSLHKP